MTTCDINTISVIITNIAFAIPVIGMAGLILLRRNMDRPDKYDPRNRKQRRAEDKKKKKRVK